MAIVRGGIVSFGGSTGSSSGGSSSGIQTLNGLVGPDITLVGTSGIEITPIAADQINIGFQRFAENFSGTSGLFTHSLNNFDVIIQVYDRNTGGARQVIPDKIIIENLDQASVIFNQPVTNYRVIII